ncbi:AAA family ATPase [Nodosilinea sp. LEGE 07088]|uniref:AAA family ATPase n=1 Tax=Nodosilinea sp. LEGE 07088 TaxID=2777968 RepID=UPI00187EE00E|nr:AAA family ATPase [Nodosilinea sp. LEGE 07088]MBE9137556.1 AAA family ATPase [Nodosilinea sp. LEGE 07088]
MAVPLLLLVGIPGSGKSTWARAVAVSGRHQIVSTDAIRADLYGSEACQGEWRQIWQRVLDQWHQGVAAIHRGGLEAVIYDATNARRCHRQEAIAAARTTGFDAITLVWFDVSLSLALARNRSRSRPVPEAIIATMHRQLQGAPPSLLEGVEDVIRLRPGQGESTSPGI